MVTVTLRRMGVLGAGIACALITASVFAGSASADFTHFGCRASVARVTLGVTVEPAVANKPGAPCVPDTQGIQPIQVPSASNDILTVGPAQAITATSASIPSIFGTAPAGVAAVTAIDAVNIPAAKITVVGPIQDEAGFTCTTKGTVASFASSNLSVLKIGGQTINLSAPGVPKTYSLGPLGYIAVNETIRTSNSITERALDVHLNGLADIIVGEAQATFSGDPCSPTGPTGPTGPTSPTGPTGPTSPTGPTVPPIIVVPPRYGPCPTGSVIDPASGNCVIFYRGGVIYVSPPFKGPHGGTVLPLAVARKKYHSPCLHGRGPAYILVATKPHGRVYGTPRSDRILALGVGERVAGLGGNDCIDGAGGHGQKLYDGNGNDRLYGGPGSNRIAVGNGNDHIWGRSGRGDWITGGNGNDVVRGARGRTRIDLGLGRDRIYGGPARNRIWVIGNHARVNCGSGRHNTAFVAPGAVAFARSHGCRTIHVLTGHHRRR